MATYKGFNPPFFGGPQNVLSQQTDERLIKNDILQAILTHPSERVYRPTFGTRVRSTVFDPNEPDLEADLRDDITRMIALDERVVLDYIDIVRKPDDLTVGITVVVIPTNDPLARYVIETSLSSTNLQLSREAERILPRI